MEKNQKVREFFRRNYAFVIAFVIILAWHTCMELNIDSVWFSIQLDKATYAEYIKARYMRWTSRLLIETGLLFFTRHMVLWRIVDTAVWVFILYGMTKLLNRNYTGRFSAVVCLLAACYHVSDMNSAGWVAGINNYIWPFACLCGVMLLVKELFFQREVKWYAGALGVILTVCACNHEQAAVATLGSIFCCIAYMVWKKIKVSRWLWGYFATAVASLVFILTCPGNGMRKTIEISAYFKEYPELSLGNKLDIGITSLCYYNIFEKNYLFLIFLAVLCVVVWKKQIPYWQKCVAAFPLAGTLTARYFLDDIAGIVPGILSMRNPLGAAGTYVSGSEWSIVTIIFYIGIMGLVLWELFLIFRENQRDGILLLVILGIGFGTRFMMCLAPSIWISGYRTCIFWQMALILATGYLWEYGTDNSDRKILIWMVGALALVSLGVTTNYIIHA